MNCPERKEHLQKIPPREALIKGKKLGCRSIFSMLDDSRKTAMKMS
jgi:hypothetical protein